MNWKAILLAVPMSLAVAGFSHAAGIIKVDGSSTVFPITEAVSEEYGKAGGGKVMVGISGTGGGFKRFCRGETDISDASRPIKAKEMTVCKENSIDYIELPVAFDGLSVVVNINNTWVDALTVAELKKIWEPSAQGTVTKWSQVRLGWPDEEIKLYGPGTDSGTFDYFTEVINGKSGSSRGDYTASEDDNVLVEGVGSERGGLGYFGLAYYEQNKDKLKAVPVVNNAGVAVAPSLETVQNGTYTPLSRPIFIYVGTKALKDNPDVAKFAEYYMDHAPALSEEVGYVPMPASAYADAKSRLVNRVKGSVYTK